MTNDRFHGILNLDKPADWTSHDVVARVRRILGQRSVGHAGTLDPLATGVLLVCVGQATRVAEYLTASHKVYRAVAQLGLTTTTYDIQGERLAEAPAPELSRDELSGVLSRFMGRIEQVPPPYSAVKLKGVPAYRRARRGETVELAPRSVEIDSIELLDWQPPLLTFEVTCGPGVYVRSLAHDLGQALGCGAALAQLTRTRSGRFTIAEALALQTLATAAEADEVEPHLHPLASALGNLTPVEVDAAAVARLMHGQPIPCPRPPASEYGYARTAAGSVAAILAYDAGRGTWRPTKVFET